LRIATFVRLDDGDLDGARGRPDLLEHRLPVGEVGGGGAVELQVLEDDVVEPRPHEVPRHLVDRELDVALLDHRLAPDVAEEADLARHLLRHRLLGAAHEHVGLDADLAQLAHRLLRGLRLHLPGGGEVGEQRDVHEHHVSARTLQRELSDGLEEGQALDVAHRPADLGDGHVHVLVGHAGVDGLLDGVGDVRDHLDRAPQVVAPPLLRDDRLVDLAGGEVAVLRQDGVREPLVVPEVQVRLGAVVGDVDLAVLERAHRARVHVDVGVELLHRHPLAAALEDHPDRRRGQALAQAADHPARDEDVLCHGSPGRV
jgi:hypothetical protein